MKSYKKILPILFITSLFAINDIQRMTNDYKKGLLTLDEFVYFQAARILNAEELPANYKTNEPIKCATSVLKYIRENSNNISSYTKQKLIDLGFTFKYGSSSARYSTVSNGRPTNLDQSLDLGIFKFHYTLSGEDAVANMQYAQTMAEIFVDVYNKQNGTSSDEMEFTRPPDDGYYSTDPDFFGEDGGDEKYDVYIYNLEAGIYGWVATEWNRGDNPYSISTTELFSATSFMAMRNHYTDFGPQTEIESIKVTAAHEYFHAVQNGYNYNSAAWLMEATAAWIEDEIYDDVNDNYQYLGNWFKEPHIALNYNHHDDDGSAIYYGDNIFEENKNHWYGSWIFFRYISEHMVPSNGNGYETIRNIFEKDIFLSDGDYDKSIEAIDEGVNAVDQSYSFKAALNGMALANSMLTTAGDYSYEEAENYINYSINLEKIYSGTFPDSEDDFNFTDGTLMRYASHYFELTSVPSSINVTFEPDNSGTSFQVNAISFSSNPPSVHPIASDTETSLDFGSEQDKVIISVVVDGNTPGEENNYKLTISPPDPIPFPKQINVFGIKVKASESVSDAKVMHAATILAEYLDNDEDGTADNITVLNQLLELDATLRMFQDESDKESSNYEMPDHTHIQDLYGEETIPNFHSETENNSSEFDASLEEVLHLITHEGYSVVYPGIFGENQGSDIADAMDIARGDYFENIPETYPYGAWFTYDDDTCDYGCMVTEYTYWALTSILGAQVNRLDEIEDEWTKYTPQLVQTDDPAVYAILTDAEMYLPTVLPNGHYNDIGDNIINQADLDITHNSAKTPTEFTISHIYPNPFNPITNISYILLENTQIKIEVFDIAGKRVQTLLNEFQTLGNHSINWNALSQSTGIYFIQLQAGNYLETKKVTYIK